MGMVGQFFLAVLVGVAAIALGLAVHEAFVALTIVTGLLLVGLAIRALNNDHDWQRFLAVQGGAGWPDGRGGRLLFVALLTVIGAVWVVVGALGVLSLLGLFEFPEQ